MVTTDSREHYRDYAGAAPHFGPAVQALLEGFPQLPEAEVHVVSCVRRPVKSPEKLAPNIFYHSLYVPGWGWMRTLYQGCIRAVRRKLKEIRPDLVHGQGTERDCAMDAAFSGFPSVLTIHGNMLDMAHVLKARPGSFHWWASRLESLALRRARGAFCNSSYTQRLVRPRTRQTWLVPNALREGFFSKPPLGKRNPRCTLLHVGVVCENKQQLEMLEVARSLHQRGLEFEFQFIGSASAGSRYARLFLDRIRAAEQQAYASYLPNRSVDELIGHFDAASALVHTPVAEAFGLVVAEAVSRDLKFFGFRVGGVPDIVEGLDGAVLLTAGDWKGLETALAEWLGARCPQPQSAAPLMRERYHPSVIARRHLEIYREVLRARAFPREQPPA